MMAVASTAAAQAPDGGALSAGGHRLPLLTSHAEIVVTGDIATVEVTQWFRNDRPLALDAEYAFALPHDAAVHRMVMEVGDERVHAVIKKVEEAKKTFAQAKAEGKTASLLQQHRANVFTQSVANIPASENVKITIAYAQSVPREDGMYRLHYPMVVASRYDNGAGVLPDGVEKPLPKRLYRSEGGGMTADAGRRQRRVSVRARLETGIRISDLRSSSHAIEVDHLGVGKKEVVLADGRVVDDRDFVLEYSLASARTGAGLVAHRDERGGFFTLLLEPPDTIPAEDVKAREIVFVIDASCSMSGRPLDAAKSLMLRMLDEVRPEDTFRTIVFGSAARHIQRAPVHPTQDNLRRVRHYVKALDTMGGTEIEKGIEAALGPEPDGDRMRMVVFLTDGYIGSELSVMATIKRLRGGARIFSFGVGDGVNRWLIDEMAIAGRGVSRVLKLDDDVDAVVRDYAARLRTPYLTDAWIDWGDVAVTDVTPAGLIDLYAGAPVRVMGRLPAKGLTSKSKATLVGRIGDRKVRVPLVMGDVKGENGAEAIAVLWARAQVARRMRDIANPQHRNPNAGEHAQLVKEITDLGLEFGITTRWTAFVAVAERTVERPAAQASVAFAQPSGTSMPSARFDGGSTPEPEQWLAMMMLASLAAAFAVRKRG